MFKRKQKKELKSLLLSMLIEDARMLGQQEVIDALLMKRLQNEKE